MMVFRHQLFLGLVVASVSLQVVSCASVMSASNEAFADSITIDQLANNQDGYSGKYVQLNGYLYVVEGEPRVSVIVKINPATDGKICSVPKNHYEIGIVGGRNLVDSVKTHLREFDETYDSNMSYQVIVKGRFHHSEISLSNQLMPYIVKSYLKDVRLIRLENGRCRLMK